jgi:ABC-type multidrug transport system fused ATPase/permease subunit
VKKVSAFPAGWLLLKNQEKYRFIRTGALYFIGSLFDLALVALTLPLIRVLNDSSQQSTQISAIYGEIDLSQLYDSQPINATLLMVFVTLCSRFLVKSAAVSSETKMKTIIASRISNELFLNYIKDSYQFHQNHDSTELTNNIINTRQINDYIYEPWLRIYYEVVSSLLIFIYLFFLSPIATSAGVILMALLIMAIQIRSANSNNQLGLQTRNSEQKTLATIRDSFSSISEIKIYGKEAYFSKKFNESAVIGISSRNRSHQLQVMTPITLEIFGLSIAFLFIYFAFSKNSGNADLIPLISSFVIALFRLIPSASSIQSSLHRIKFGSKQLQNSLEYLSNCKSVNQPTHASNFHNSSFKSMKIENLKFSFQDSKTDVISIDSFVLNQSDFIGVVGPSGAGKSTFIRLLSGLILPDSGSIRFVNSLNEDIAPNSLKFGYVPQDVHLLNDSLASNVAFGVPHNAIDFERVEKCLLDVQLHDLVKRFKVDYSEVVGEDGSLVSGGERQRIGLARAIYSQPDILILDEVTSSLDPSNETLLIELISDLCSNLTTVFVTHRIEAVRKCNRLIRIENGTVSEFT